ncbi:hypothetical protein COU56_05010 [Candidatus Pacearchaeota archaeon CG10_big_fil_rev_8_21_14_0_10_31_9]|nr:MAG: hypothetical protein AUJ62_03485 [Candidatus Pacearchaeota archaeon CG1_02_32_21]PIN91637.1 MAG: hypothetical protein COU56_05010 [Candidatus Pacearchaeota archaeon CG10_big_fil_rev_8_21_14_0_10_31_9]PIZ82770.1 MAG: hypothetical protein COX97_03120 [Candidatus Pacearchaeota archaeon CG_4_10_14_0_2_um_filter_05_32_18]
MTKLEILDKTKKKKIIENLNENYGVENMHHLFIRSGNDKIRIYSGGLSWEELNNFGKSLRVELIGASLGKIEEDNLRVNFDILNLPEIKSQINKNIVEISDSEVLEWLKGKSLEINTEIITKNDLVVVKNNQDLLGVAKNRKAYIQNYVPKERRIK